MSTVRVMTLGRIYLILAGWFLLCAGVFSLWTWEPVPFFPALGIVVLVGPVGWIFARLSRDE